jgi:hypothetical protein
MAGIVDEFTGQMGFELFVRGISASLADTN